MSGNDPLIVEYVLEGEKRGYRITTPTHHLREDVTKKIWQNAMPKGQGWSKYINAQSLKCFPLPDGQMAVSETIVTDHEDESGRRGIRRAEVQVMNIARYHDFLDKRFAQLPAGIQNDAHRQIRSWRRLRKVERLPRKQLKTEQLIITHSYNGLPDWRFIEGVVLLLTLSPWAQVQRWSRPFSLTTMALTASGEGNIVAVPQGHIRNSKDVPVLHIR